MSAVHITLGDWANEWDDEMERDGRGFRFDLSPAELVKINRGRWRMSPDRAEQVAEILFIHNHEVVAVAEPFGGIEILRDGRVAWRQLIARERDDRIGDPVEYRSYGNPIRYV
jgi:hypothetical protein